MSSIETSGCEKYIAIVVDESGSIDGTEAVQIRAGLTSFINSQSLSNTTLSLIGMSSSDSDTRTDHIIQKRIADYKQDFLDWIDDFRTVGRPISTESDFWASGLNVVNNLTVTPDIIIVITDGLQRQNPSALNNLFTALNQKSHVFVYGVSTQYYQNSYNFANLSSALYSYLNTSAVLKTNENSILSADYIELADFTTLNTELSQLTADLTNAQIGCIANVEIIESKLTSPIFKAGTVVHQEIGSLLLKNKSRIDMVLEEGTLIHDPESDMGGLVFTLRDTVTVPANSQLEVVIRVDGKPTGSGSYYERIVMENVINPNQYQFAIEFVITSGCERHVAIVVDESASISEDEASRIRGELYMFVDSQSMSNTVLSFIGMSDSDNDTRTDHILQKRIADNAQELYAWTDNYGLRGAGTQSDFWASGLKVVNNLTVTPDIIIIISDGLRVNSSSVLKDLYSTLSQKSHIFVYGASNEDSELITPLTYYLGRTPILKTESNDLLNSDYLAFPELFPFIQGEFSLISYDLNQAHVGCKANVEITQENLNIPVVLNVGTPVHQDAGTLVLENKSHKDLTLVAGTLIHSSNNIDGLVFTLKNTVTIPVQSQLIAAIRVDGIPVTSGDFSELIMLGNVKNFNGFTIDFTVGKEFINITDKTALQSPGMQLLTAGSKGYDSTKGIHLRWIFAGELGEKHLPKGTLYQGAKSGFNKEEDFVKVYRSPYVQTVFTLDLTVPPTIVDAVRAQWIYQMAEGRVFYVHFDKEKYPAIAVDATINHLAFLQSYGNNLIEIENKQELFFAAELNFSSVSSSSVLKLEALSVDENTVNAPKIVASRKTYNSSQVNTARVVIGNGRSLRFKARNCIIHAINFEFYSDFIIHANEAGTWKSKGNYGLSKNDTEVYELLEPQYRSVHGKWLKYNDGEYVNVNNYKNKWIQPAEEGDKNLKKVVDDYIFLSADPDNPTAIEHVSFGPSSPDAEEDEELQEGEELDEEGGAGEGPGSGEEGSEEFPNTIEMSNLDMLNIAANDYHIARMLGLGFLDIDGAVYSGDYIYVAEYTTFGDLKDGLGPREVHHLSMGLPTSLEKERLPLPVNLNKIVPGLNVNSEGEESKKITDDDGYSFDGKKRYVSLFMDSIENFKYDTLFFDSPLEFEESTFTFPIYAGLDYKIDNSLWIKPELSHDLDYFNVNEGLGIASNEPVPIVFPEDFKNSFYNVRHDKTGEHKYTYQGYGINIFSRTTSGKQVSIVSKIKPANVLMPPIGINALLITEENPLMFTSKNEQDKLAAIIGEDKTYIRLLFEYYTIQELLSYSIPPDLNTLEASNSKSVYNPNTIYPDTEEVFADYFDIYFRDSLPLAETARIVNVDNNPNNSIISTVNIESFVMLSSGEAINLNITAANKDRFIGGILAIGEQNYVIHQIIINGSLISVEVINKEVITSIVSEGNATIDSDQIKPITIPENRLCNLVENMLTPSNWHQPGPISLRVQYPENLKTVHREVIKLKDSQGKADWQVEKTRGIWWENTKIKKEKETVYQLDSEGKVALNANDEPIELEEKKHVGLYSLTFEGFQLPQHPQGVPDALGNTVDWFNGVVRLFTKSSVEPGSNFPIKPRKEFKVVRTENIGGTGDLVLYINDTNFKLAENTYEMDPDYDHIIADEDIRYEVNYYPHYNVHLLASPADGLTKENIQPRAGEKTHYSIFGIRTYGTNDNPDPGSFIEYNSKISVPATMYAVKKEKPEKPGEPLGGSYATRPDYFKRSTYTYTTKFSSEGGRKPHSVLNYRANDEVLLSVLYKPATIKIIRENLKRLGGNNEVWFNDRWKEFLNFELLATKESYSRLPEDVSEDGYSFPMPDREDLIQSINDFIQWHNASSGLTGDDADKPIESITALNKELITKNVVTPVKAIHFIEEAIHTVFVPLTEIPVIYSFINDSNYVPVNKKQTIKDKNGHILKPNDPALDIAPMMKIVNENDNITQFTDFTLDGTAQNIYFYGVREMDIQMNLSAFSPFLGPIKLVPSNAPQTPEIKRIMPVLENPVLGIKPAIQIELNPYHPEQKIKKINIYRASSMLDAQSTRTMTLVKEVLITEDTLSPEFDNIWRVYDEFDDLESVPFGEGVFYRVTVSREIEYAEAGTDNIIIDYTPSQPSKITATIIADNVSPESPVVEAAYETDEETLSEVTFSWEKTVHNGKYHLYRMNNQGNWEKIHEMASNNSVVSLPLGDIESYDESDELIIKSADDERIYHHFKVIAENSSGMFSSQEKMLTL